DRAVHLRRLEHAVEPIEAPRDAELQRGRWYQLVGLGELLERGGVVARREQVHRLSAELARRQPIGGRLGTDRRGEQQGGENTEQTDRTNAAPRTSVSRDQHQVPSVSDIQRFRYPASQIPSVSAARLLRSSSSGRLVVPFEGFDAGRAAPVGA